MDKILNFKPSAKILYKFSTENDVKMIDINKNWNKLQVLQYNFFVRIKFNELKTQISLLDPFEMCALN